MIVRDTYSETVEQNVARTSFDDGAIAQKRTAARDWKLRSFDIFVTAANLATFQTFLTTWAHRDFAFVDLDGMTRQVRVRGGNGSVSLEAQSGRLNGERYFRGSIELEGYA